MFSNNNDGSHRSNSRLKIAVISTFAATVALSVASPSILQNSKNSLALANAGNVCTQEITQTAIYSTMAAGVADNLQELPLPVDNAMFPLTNNNSFEIGFFSTPQDILNDSNKQIEIKLDELKMNIYPKVSISKLRASSTSNTKTTANQAKSTKATTKMTTTTTTSAVTQSSASSTAKSGPAGTDEQMAAWEYLLSQTSYVSNDVKSHINSITTFKQSYALTDYERSIIEKAVMAENGTEPYLGVVAVAQCLRESAEHEGVSPVTILTKYQWTSARVTPNQKVKDAVKAVFDYGIRVTNKPIMFFYNPYITSNRGHEAIFSFVFQISKVRFFCPK